jgi:hypothetical protein
MSHPSNATQSLPVYLASDFIVTHGVAEGDHLSFADELMMDDVYGLSENALRQRLTLSMNDTPRHFTIAPGGAAGIEGNLVVMDCCITLMVPDGTTYEALVLVEVENNEVAEIYLLPLGTLVPDTPYRLVGVDRDAAATKFSEVACVSFTKGTKITMADGAQTPIEDLRVGDKVLTRDSGAQEIRWIGQSTTRATGAFAPVVITKGTLHNENDLVVSPDHRIFIYQRQDRLGAGRSEVLVKVRHLINGTSVYQRDGGFVDYYQILFDEHQIIYAEGIAAESLLIDHRTKGALPEALKDRLDQALNTHEQSHHANFEVTESMMAMPDAVELLKRASSS